MKELLDALVTKFTDASLPASITGGLYALQAPDSPLKATPFATLNVITAPLILGFGSSTPKTAEVTVQFSVFDRAGRTAMTLMDSLITAYDDFTPTLSGKKCTGQMRLGDGVPVLPDRDIRDDATSHVFGVHVQYTYWVQ